MGRPARSEQFHPSEIGIVHTVQRCVRRAFLAGVDPVSGKDYSFRRECIRRRMEALASVFGIDVLTYAIHNAGDRFFCDQRMSKPSAGRRKLHC